MDWIPYLLAAIQTQTGRVWLWVFAVWHIRHISKANLQKAVQEIKGGQDAFSSWLGSLKYIQERPCVPRFALPMNQGTISGLDLNRQVSLPLV